MKRRQEYLPTYSVEHRCLNSGICPFLLAFIIASSVLASPPPHDPVLYLKLRTATSPYPPPPQGFLSAPAVLTIPLPFFCVADSSWRHESKSASRRRSFERWICIAIGTYSHAALVLAAFLGVELRGSWRFGIYSQSHNHPKQAFDKHGTCVEEWPQQSPVKTLLVTVGLVDRVGGWNATDGRCGCGFWYCFGCGVWWWDI
jgi:hypothetical protein